MNRISQYDASQLVFVDESSVDRRTTYRGRAWSICGTQAQRKVFFIHGRRYSIFLHSYLAKANIINILIRFSVLPAISLQDGILHCKIVEGSFCMETFLGFIEGLLEFMQPYPQPNSVIVMDNCKIHKNPAIQAAITAR
jgi:hypothetical protein